MRVCFCSFCLGFLTHQSTADDEGVPEQKGKGFSVLLRT